MQIPEGSFSVEEFLSDFVNSGRYILCLLKLNLVYI